MTYTSLCVSKVRVSWLVNLQSVFLGVRILAKLDPHGLTRVIIHVLGGVGPRVKVRGEGEGEGGGRG